MEEVGEDDGADPRGEVVGDFGGKDVDNLQMNASAQERRSQRDPAEQEENVLEEQMESVIVKWIPSKIPLLLIQECTA